MGKQASRAMIGAFVVGAVPWRSPGSWCSLRKSFSNGAVTDVLRRVAEGSAGGLPRGDERHQDRPVTDIHIVGDLAALKFYSPVYIEIEADKIRVAGQEKTTIREFMTTKYKYYQKLLDKGMKAQLVMQSFVTGQLLVSLGLHPTSRYDWSAWSRTSRRSPRSPRASTSCRRRSRTCRSRRSPRNWTTWSPGSTGS